MALAFLIAIGPFLLACLLAYGYYRKAGQSEREARGLTILAANLEGQLKQSEDKADRMTAIARDAIRAGALDVGLEPDDVLPDSTLRSVDPEMDEKYQKINARIAAYVPQTATNCVKCGVSVRYPPEAFPVPCPACTTLIDPILDNPPLID